LFADEDVWRELERWGAVVALVRFSGGGGHPGSVAAVSLEDAGLVMWDAAERQVIVAGERGGQRFDEVLSAPRPLTRLTVLPAVPTTPRDTSPRQAAPADQRSSLSDLGAGEASRVCERCGEPLPAGVRSEARYCSKRCRQAVSRARLKLQPPKSPSPPPEKCSWCGGPMPAGVRAEARFCSKRCRQASSRHALKARRSTEPSGSGDTSLGLVAPAATARSRNG